MDITLFVIIHSLDKSIIDGKEKNHVLSTLT